jgi:uncharacterized protein (TIGR00661 family)
MKVLYAIQGTGNGHVARAREIVPLLQRLCPLDVLISGIQSDVPLPYPVQYRYKGMSFVFGKKGGVDIWQTYAQNRIRRIWHELHDFPAEQYDLIINDFEPISAWSARRKGVPCVSLSHQCAVLAPGAPRPPQSDPLGLLVLGNYAPTDRQYGFHFDRYAPNIYTPVIRQEVRQLAPAHKGHYTVYLPAYSDERLVQHLGQFREARWQVFSKHNRQARTQGNVELYPIQNDAFLHSMASSEGVLCGAGFETPAEALFLGKKVMVVPMKGQYEQHCNAAAIATLGVPVIGALSAEYYPAIRQWLAEGQAPAVHYPDEIGQVLEQVLADFEQGRIVSRKARS